MSLIIKDTHKLLENPFDKGDSAILECYKNGSKIDNIKCVLLHGNFDMSPTYVSLTNTNRRMVMSWYFLRKKGSKVLLTEKCYEKGFKRVSVIKYD